MKAFLSQVRFSRNTAAIKPRTYFIAPQIADLYRPRKEIAIRLVILAWCLAILILLTSYTTLLISVVTAPNPQPLIKSIYELPNRPEILPITDKGRNVAALFLVLLKTPYCSTIKTI